jgi:uncharacterized membrane protein
VSVFLYVATLVTALGCGLVAGIFFAFSTFAMAGLRRIPPAQGIAAMQSINRQAETPPLMTVLFGTAAACLGLLVWALISWGGRPAAMAFVGGALYIVGTIGVTIVCNVPLNNMLARLHPQSAKAEDRWEEYVTRWIAWNHVRTITALAAAAALTVALHAG